MTSQKQSAAGRLAFDSDGDPLPNASNFAHRAALDRGDRRINGTQEKNAGNANMLQRLANDARLKRRDVGRDVRQFRHG